MDKELKTAVKQYMLTNLDLGEWMQTGEIERTRMAEDAMDTFGLGIEFLDDMFEVVHTVATAYEAYLQRVR